MSIGRILKTVSLAAYKLVFTDEPVDMRLFSSATYKRAITMTPVPFEYLIFTSIAFACTGTIGKFTVVTNVTNGTSVVFQVFIAGAWQTMTIAGSILYIGNGVNSAVYQFDWQSSWPFALLKFRLYDLNTGIVSTIKTVNVINCTTTPAILNEDGSPILNEDSVDALLRG